MQSELSIYLRLLAPCRLPSGKHTSILTNFQTKVNNKTAKKALFLAINSKLYILNSARHPDRSPP